MFRKMEIHINEFQLLLRYDDEQQDDDYFIN